MQISIATAARKRTVAAVAAALALAYIAFAASRVLASWFGDRVEQSSLQRAVRLDPGNADYRDHLGRYYALVVRDPASAIAPYLAAVHLNPHSARYWFDLASDYQVLADPADQTYALEHAIEADPTTPDVAWEAANLYLVQGQTAKALREFRVVLANDSTLVNPAINFCWRIQPDVEALLRDVVPVNSDAYIAFLNLLLSKNETAGAALVWDALIQSGQPFERRYETEYFQYLISHKEVDEAVLVWRQAANRFGLTSYLPSSENLMVNGNFSLDVLNDGLDWRYEKQSGVQLMLDNSDFHGGRRSLSISFDGPGITDAGIYELVPVQPNTTYQFSAYYKNGDIEGAGGPHFTVQDMYTPANVYYESDELKDAGFWKLSSGDFTTAADCKMVVVHVRRLPAGSPIRGKLWIDDFRLARKQQ
ncbi:MAG TPA: carbohydrate binding domain-containing protein [Terriglobia bacterium]|nr:carbohydrate binding domain-containing protein [Terriglobia bacterium]